MSGRDTIASRIGRPMLGLIVLMIFLFSVMRLFESHDDVVPVGAVAHRIGMIAETVDAAPRQDRPALLAVLHSAAFTIALDDAALPQAALAFHLSRWILRRRIEASVGAPVREVIVASGAADGAAAAGAGPSAPSAAQTPAMAIQVPLSDGQWLRFTIAAPDQIGAVPYWPFLSRTGSILVLVWLLSIWTARRLAAPIAAFANAADRLGKDTDAAPLVESGPLELRIATRAFNQMQDRLQRFVRDRTQMLAAMSHDLRTPLTRLTLRAEFIKDPRERGKMLRDLEQMIAMIESTLSFAREDFNRETRALVDLRALIENICEDAADDRASVSCSVAESIDLECRPQALRRAIANLVDNAVKYGSAARVSVLREGSRVVIQVDDDGPGIPPDQQEKVFAPFYRLESSRNRETGGAGLGLALVRTIVHGHGGTVAMANRAEGGLRVRMELPA